ncbi:MAG: N-acetylmuramoyl-L-alanine amidase [Myxococcota bacterium]
MQRGLSGSFRAFGLTLLLVGCHGGVVERSEARSVYEGSDATELLSSGIQHTDEPVARLVLRWDSKVESTVSVQFSADGQAWSEWQEVVTTFVERHELEPTRSDSDGTTHASTIWLYAGQADSPEGPVNFYRFKSNVGEEVNFIAMSILPVVPRAFEPPPTLEDVIPVPPDVPSIPSEPTVPTMPSATVNDRASWGARPTRCTTRDSGFDRITIHHTAGPNNDPLSTPARLRQLQSAHMDGRGWCDVGYHFIVSQDGRLWEARSLPLRGAHTANHNSRNIGISYAGNYETALPSNSQLQNGADLLAMLAKDHAIPLDGSRIKGHRDFGATLCPGEFLYSQLGTLIDLAHDHTGAGDGSDHADPPTIVIDSNQTQNDSRLAQVDVSENWGASSRQPDFYGTGYWFASTGAVSDPAVFSFYLDRPGSHSVDVWWTVGTDRSPRAPFIISDSSGNQLDLVHVDQTVDGGRWNTLGTYSFGAGWNTVQLSRWAAEGSVVIADAIRVRRLPE